MSPDDPRHGSTAGFHAGCREVCCRRARSRYEKEGRLARLNGGRAVPALGAQRRLMALMRLGWTSTHIAEAAGWPHRNHIFRILKGQKGKPTTWLERDTDRRIRDVYDRLSMTLPPRTPATARTASLAARKGYMPPLAWDDEALDDPNARPVGMPAERDRLNDIDPQVIERFLRRDITPGLWATQAEKREIVRRWDGSLAELERMTGWKPERYYRRGAA